MQFLKNIKFFIKNTEISVILFENIIVIEEVCAGDPYDYAPKCVQNFL